MKAPARLFALACVWALLLTLSACSGKKDGNPDEKETEDQIKYLTHMLLNYADANGKGAPSIEKLEPFMKLTAHKDDDSIVSRVKSGDYVIAWGVSQEDMQRGPGGMPEQMVVYEKDAATKGGFVGMGDMKVKKVTPEEFKKLKFAEKFKKKKSETD